jgi:hypothetical protein
MTAQVDTLVLFAPHAISAQVCMTTPRATVTAAPCSGMSVIFTISARRRWRRSAALSLALNGKEKDTFPAFNDESVSRPTRACFEWSALTSGQPGHRRPDQRSEGEEHKHA